MKKGTMKEHAFLRLIKETKPIAGWLALGAILNVLAVISAVAAPEILGLAVQSLYDFWEGGCAGTVRDAIAGGLGVLLAL